MSEVIMNYVDDMPVQAGFTAVMLLLTVIVVIAAAINKMRAMK